MPNQLQMIKELASALLAEAELLDKHDFAGFAIEHRNLKSGISFYDEVRSFEIRLIEKALELTCGNQLKAARLLGIRDTTLSNKVKKYAIRRKKTPNHVDSTSHA